MRVALVIGTRPQIIESAPIIHAAKDFPVVELLIVHTGQHYDYACLGSSSTSWRSQIRS